MLVNTDAVVRLYSEIQPRRKVKSPVPDDSIGGTDGGATTDNTMESSTATEQNSTDDSHTNDSIMSNIVKRGVTVYGKLSFTAAVASIAIFWVKVLKKRK
jgi:hypothetical protein